jgi:hypothetical protein
MSSHQIRRLIGSGSFAALAFGTFAAFDGPAGAQTITVKCWKEYCVTDPETNRETCVKEEIPCPPQNEN